MMRAASMMLASILAIGCGSSPPSASAPGAARADDAVSPTEDLPAGAHLRFGTVRLRWHGVPEDLIFSPDGRLLVGISLDEVVRVWDARSGRRLLRLEDRHRGRGDLLAGAVSPDSRLLATGGYSGVVVIWNLVNGARVRELGNLKNVRRLAFSPDGSRLAIAAEGALVLVDTATWREVSRDDTGELTPTTFRFTADGKLLAAPAIPDAPRDVRAVAVSHDGATIALGRPTALELRAADTGAIRATLPPPTTPKRDSALGYEHVAFSPDDRLIATCFADLGAWILSADGTAAPRQLDDRAQFAIGWSPDGAVLAADSVSPAVHLWRVADGSRLDPDRGHENELTDLALSGDGTTLVTAGRDHTVRIWDAHTGALRRTITTDEEPYVVAIDATGARIFVGFDHPIVRAYDAATGAARAEARVPDAASDREYVTGLALRDRVLAVAASTGTVFLDADTLAARPGVDRYRAFSVRGGLLSPDGRLFAVTADDGLSLIDRDTGRPTAEPRAMNAYDRVAAWSPDGKLLLIAGNEGQLELVPAAGGAPVVTLQQPRPRGDEGLLAASAAAFSPDGALLATADYEGRITLWDLATRAIVRSFDGHDDAVDALVFSPDGATLYSASRDSTALAWSVR